MSQPPEPRRHKFPASVPRAQYWSDEVGGTDRCPSCGGMLESEHHIYLMGTFHHGETEANFAATRFGYFCPECPIVVLDYEEFKRLAVVTTHDAEETGFNVAGLIDLEAIPPEKRGVVPLGDDDNPIPLVKFTNSRRESQTSPMSGDDRARERNRRKRERRKRRRG